MKISCYRAKYALAFLEHLGFRTKNIIIFRFCPGLVMVLIILVCGSCETFEFSPNQTNNHKTPRALNEKNLQKLFSNPVDDTVTIAFTGDSQRWYSELDRFVGKANEIPEIDFILIAGDISDFGLLQEFEWMNSRLSKLTKPYFGVIGNHDLTANGEAIFERMFGPLNYSFVYDSIKFVAHNTNSLEYNSRTIPKMSWLEDQLKTHEDVKYIIPVSHVPPFSPLEFSSELVQPYTQLFRQTPKLLLSLHGHVHEHNDFYPFEDGVRYMTSYSFGQNAFVLLKIANGHVLKTIVNY